MDEIKKAGSVGPPGLLDEIRKLGPEDSLDVTPEECAEALQQLFRWVGELEEEEGSTA